MSAVRDVILIVKTQQFETGYQKTARKTQYVL